MIDVNYQKRKNTEFFKSLENPKLLFLSNTQNYIPIYTRFFSLNDTNYNNINLNNKWFITNVNDRNKENENLHYCQIKNVETNKTKNKEVFFKMAPLLDPYKYLIGKYDITNPNIFNLPSLTSDKTNTMEKILDVNNSSYTDGFFSFLSSNLIHKHGFLHGVDYYGSYLSIKNKFNINVFDDLEYLTNSIFFNKNKNILFTIDNYDHLFNDEKTKLNPIEIGNNCTLKSHESIKSLNDDVFDNLFDNNNTLIDLKDMKDMSIDLIDITNSNNVNEQHLENVTLKSNSTCSSRTSYTSNELDENCEECETNSESGFLEEDNDINSRVKVDDDTDNKEEEDEKDDEEYDDEDDEEEEKINVVIPKFPVQVICMEYCENTFDDLIMNGDLSDSEWFSALMQIIMILITYQKAFGFTHNDLHTNNVMYNKTTKKYIYYVYKKQIYKVPTFGKIYKIIDFGRSIYKFGGKIFCSDSFQTGGDAATQYNTEPYFNDKKPRLEPNFSFDLCRLACSIFDYVIEDISDTNNTNNLSPVQKLINEWCLDDKGLNMLYKNNGIDRYPDFKLYKMISRCVHNHNPSDQLERPEFKAYSKFKGPVNDSDVINIDNIPSYV
jgi:hypothetical protein